MTDLFDRHTPPMRPWEYLRIRRVFARLTIEQAAAANCWRRPEHREDCERIYRSFEQRGYAIREDYAVESVARSIPFEPSTYITLRDCPPEQHPSICRGCGSTPWDMPVNRDGTEATMLPHLVCTACEAQRETTRATAIRRAA